MNLASLQKTIHAIAKEKGWHDAPLRSGLGLAQPLHVHTVRVLAKLALVHSELSEASVEAQHERWATWYSDAKPGKPEGYAIEIADACIRVLDTCEALGLELSGVPPSLAVPPTLLRLHERVSDAVEAARVGDFETFRMSCERFIDLADRLLDDCVSGPTLEEAIELKIAYNRTRPHMHGGKLA